MQPCMSAKDAGGMDAILAEYTPGGSIGDRLYCKTLMVLQGAIPDVTATSNFGTLEKTEDTKCWEVASFFAPVYTSSSDISNELQYSAKVSEIYTALKASSWDVVKSMYNTYFKTWAVGISSLSGDDASKVNAYFKGDKKNAADYIQMSLDGTAPRKEKKRGEKGWDRADEITSSHSASSLRSPSSPPSSLQN